MGAHSSEIQVVKDRAARLPHVGVPVLLLALICEVGLRKVDAQVCPEDVP